MMHTKSFMKNFNDLIWQRVAKFDQICRLQLTYKNNYNFCFYCIGETRSEQLLNACDQCQFLLNFNQFGHENG